MEQRESRELLRHTRGCRRLVPVDIDASLGKGLQSFLGQIVPDAAIDDAVRISAREFLGIDASLPLGRSCRDKLGQQSTGESAETPTRDTLEENRTLAKNRTCYLSKYFSPFGQ